MNGGQRQRRSLSVVAFFSDVPLCRPRHDDGDKDLDVEVLTSKRSPIQSRMKRMTKNEAFH